MKDDRFYPLHIRDALADLGAYASPGRDAFFADRLRQDGIIRKLEVSGEAVKGLSVEARVRRPEIPWRQIAGMRDKIAHEYFGVNLELVWMVGGSDPFFLPVPPAPTAEPDSHRSYTLTRVPRFVSQPIASRKSAQTGRISCVSARGAATRGAATPLLSRKVGHSRAHTRRRASRRPRAAHVRVSRLLDRARRSTTGRRSIRASRP